MELKYIHFSLYTVFSVLLLFLVPRNGEAQICQGPSTVHFNENNNIGTVVANITIQDGATLILKTNPEDAFDLNGPQVIVTKRMDFETLTSNPLTMVIECQKIDASPMTLVVVIFVEDVNDNVPVFEQSQYILQVNELTPVDTSVGRVEAKDADGDILYYRLEPSTDAYFKIQSSRNPNILVQNLLDYDSMQKHTFVIVVQDAPLSTETNHTATATVTVNILDIDNRPPWFQPCVESVQGFTKICLNSGYRGKVNQTEQAPGAVTLDPGPVYAIDGDKGKKDEITYRILAGNEDGIFDINPNSGNITMLKPANVLGPIILTVMASQLLNSNQYAITSVTFMVVKRSAHPPRFVKEQYEGYTSSDSGPESMVLEMNSNRLLRVQATDGDFFDGVNPDIVYKVPGSNAFWVTAEGFVFIKAEVPPGLVDLQIYAVDSSNEETGTATLVVRVLPGSTTEPSTTDISTNSMATESTGFTQSTSSTTEPSTTGTPETSMATESTGFTQSTSSTTEPSTTGTPATSMATERTEFTQSTSNSYSTVTLTATEETTLSSASSYRTAGFNTTNSLSPSTSLPHTEGAPWPAGRYRTEDMAAVGASLAVVVGFCLIIIGLLIFRIRKGKADWQKLTEASIFRSSFVQGSSGPKDSMQYTNDGFQNDGDTGDLKVQDSGDASTSKFLEAPPPDKPTVVTSVALYDTFLPDTSSLASGSDRADSDKGVKPILTKERRSEEGYKSVWFKEDIDPSAKEEVVIIPDNEDHDEEDSFDIDDSSPIASPKLFLTDTRKDNKVADKNGASDLEEEDGMNVHL